MNEETQKNQPEKSGLDDRRKTALLRYVAILFAVAFVMVLFSMLTQMRNSEAALTELNRSSASALQKAEQLQEANQSLQQDNNALRAKLKSTEQKQAEAEDLRAQLNEAEAEQLRIAQAYEELLTAMDAVTPGSQEGNVAFAKAYENLEELKQYLGRNGLEKYETLLDEGE